MKQEANLFKHNKALLLSTAILLASAPPVFAQTNTGDVVDVTTNDTVDVTTDGMNGVTTTDNRDDDNDFPWGFARPPWFSRPSRS